MTTGDMSTTTGASGRGVLQGGARRVVAVLAAISAAFVIFGQTIFLALKRFSIVQHPSYPFWVLLLLFVGVAAISAVRSAEWRGLVRSINWIDAWFAVFVVIVLISFSLEGPDAGREFAFDISALCVFPYVAMRLFSREQAALFLKTGLAVASVGALVAVLYVMFDWSQLALADRFVLFPVGKTVGTPGDPSVIFLTISLTVPLLFLVAATLNLCDLISSRDRLLLFLAAAGLLVTSWWIIRSGSRAGLAALLVAVVFMIVFAHWRSWARRLSIGLLFGLALVGALLLQPQERLDFLAQVPCAIDRLVGVSGRDLCGEPVAGSTSPELRMKYLRDAVPMIAGQLAFGVGAGNFGFRASSSAAVPFASPHLLLVHVLAETGIFGLIAMMALLLSALWVILRGIFACRGNARRLVWMVGTVWVFFAGLENLSGNYFSAMYLYALTGLVAAQVPMVSGTRSSRNGGERDRLTE